MDSLLFRALVCLWFAGFFYIRYRTRQQQRSAGIKTQATVKLKEEVSPRQKVDENVSELMEKQSAVQTEQPTVNNNTVVRSNVQTKAKVEETSEETVESTTKSTERSASTSASKSVTSPDLKLNDSSMVANVSPKKSGYFELDPDIHIRIRPGMQEHMHLVESLREYAKSQEPTLANDEYIMTDIGLWRYLVARKLDMDGARKQVLSSLRWRDFRKPTEIRAEQIKIEVETGKESVRGLDIHGRPVVVLDSSRENTWNMKGNMEGLVYTLERAFRKMPPGVDKYVLVIRLEDTSFFNFSKLPGPSQVRETIKVLMTVYAERLGHAIVYKPPGIFTVFLNLFRSLMDAHVLSKAVWVYGDVSPGSQNDKSLTALLGPNWRELIGEGQPLYNPKWSPGYNSPVEYEKIVAEEEEYLRTKAQQQKQSQSQELKQQ